ncbi:PfaB family protein [Moritella viscosa]|uniref:Beta-ketoacyl synthase n=1 Tax=Moritella viscosa TaxID=80854 RepID=A0ABY1HLI0_9GAMM|nr:PfaB family protein [Moritella viscosa]SGY99535.1 Beta-ketoacyl synthase [Moritella viscosa]SGZ14512.1 Beta-ketoacyl synthase [Moritella viscosa]SHO27956.1 Beta-ketoacyl synthase [Moritella viscosa]
MTELAVIGMDAKFSGQDNIDRVERAFYLGASICTNTRGINNAEDQHSAENKMATTVLTSVALLAETNQLDMANIAVLLITDVSSCADDQLVQQVAQQCASCVVITDLGQALKQATDLVNNQDCTVAVIGINNAVNVPSTDIKANSDIDAAEEAVATISFDETFSGYNNVTGFASLLISSTDFANTHQCYIYANIKGFAQSSENTELNVANIADTARLALQQAQVTAERVGLLEVTADSKSELALSESQGLMSAYNHTHTLHTALSCARSVTGEGGYFSQVAGLLKAVISLHQRYIPAIKDWQQPIQTQISQWQRSSFYMPVDARPWFPHTDGSAHTAAYSCISHSLPSSALEQGYCHVILQENKVRIDGQDHPVSDVRGNGFFAASDLALVIIQGDDEAQLRSELERIAGQSMTTGIKKIATDCYVRSDSNKVYSAVLIAETAEELSKEITLAFAGISSVFNDANVSEWKTPKGSYFTGLPANRGTDHCTQGGIAFLYPGIGATYVGLGRDLFHLFPQIFQPVAALADDIGSSLKDTLLSPRSISRHNFKQLKQLDLDLRGNLANIAEAGVGFACVFTKVFEEVFAVKADFATGYSMGEVSMYAALGCWQQPGLMSARLAQSNTFNHQLCGELRTLRQHWGMDDVPSGTFEQIWETYTIKATIEQVEIAAADEDRVYCTIINTPDSLLLAGYPEACQRVIKKLGKRAMALNMANAIHSAPAYAEYDHMVELYHMDVTERIKTKMYSSSCYLAIPQRSKAISHSIAKCLCDVVDFPRLVNTLHDKGARVFIEMGPGRSLCSWVDKILAHEQDDSRHVSVPVNAKGTSDELTYIRAIAKLVSHGVNLDLDSLFNGSILVKAGRLDC